MSLEIHAVSTTVDCTVSSGSGHLSAEVDSRAWGHNGGKTQFFQGDNCYVLVYKSSNVNIIGGSVINAESFKETSDRALGDNVVREGIMFSSPIANAQKPLPNDVKAINTVYNRCSVISYYKGNMVLRLKTWEVKSPPDPSNPPPYAFIFIEYTPDARLWKFSSMQATPGLLNSPVHGAIYGITIAEEPAFKTL